MKEEIIQFKHIKKKAMDWNKETREAEMRSASWVVSWEAGGEGANEEI